MKDVAKEAGVHQTTVSLSLRNHPSIPAKTRERIQKIAQEIGYRPDPMLSTLIAYRRNNQVSVAPPTIAYIMDICSEEALKKSQARELFLKSAKARAEEQGYKLEVFNYAPGHYDSQTLDRTLITRNINGIILGAFWDANTDLELSWEHYSVIKIEMLPFNLKFDVVENNQMQATRLAMEKVKEMGYRRVGMAVGQHDEAHTKNLFSAGYFVGQTQFDPEDRVPILVFEGKNLVTDAEEISNWIIENDVEVLISNWYELEPVIEAFTERTGRQIKLVSLDIDHDKENISGVHQNHEVVGRYAVDRVTSLMRMYERGKVNNPTTHLIDACWKAAGEAQLNVMTAV